LLWQAAGQALLLALAAGPACCRLLTLAGRPKLQLQLAMGEAKLMYLEK